VTWCVITYLGMVHSWVWPPTRLLVPIVPLVLWQVSVAVRPVPRLFVAALAIAVIVRSSAAVFELATEAQTRVIKWPIARPSQDPQGWRRLAALYEWIRRETPIDAVLIGDVDPTYFLYTGRKAVRVFVPDGYAFYYDPAEANPLGTAETFRRLTLGARADFWVWSDGPARLRLHTRLLDEVSRQYPGSLSAATDDPESGYAVYRIDRARLMTSPGIAEEPPQGARGQSMPAGGRSRRPITE
jgi:hypothetical protein